MSRSRPAAWLPAEGVPGVPRDTDPFTRVHRTKSSSSLNDSDVILGGSNRGGVDIPKAEITQM